MVRFLPLLTSGASQVTVEIYNFSSDTWRNGTSQARADQVNLPPEFVYLNNKYILKFGQGQTNFHCYDIESDEWIDAVNGQTEATRKSSYLLVPMDVFSCTTS